MASSTLLTSLLKFSQVGRNTQNTIPFLASSCRRIHASTQLGNQAEETKENIKQSIGSAAEHATQKSKDVAGKVSESAKDAAEKAKQTADDVLVSTKDAAQRAKDTVLNRTEVSKEYVKENAEKVKKSMNSKE